MQARGPEAEHDIARFRRAARKQTLSLDDADGKAGEIVFTAAVKAGKLGGLAADQRATGTRAPFGDAGDDVCGLCDVDAPAGEIVEKEKWIGAVAQDVIDAHRDQIDTDRFVGSSGKGNLQFRADAVAARHENRIF